MSHAASRAASDYLWTRSSACRRAYVVNRKTRSIFIATAALAAVLVPASTAGAAVRYAGAGITGGTCTQLDPCSLATALSGTASGDTVYMTTGTYMVGSTLTVPTGVTLIGIYGTGRPFIDADAGLTGTVVELPAGLHRALLRPADHRARHDRHEARRRRRPRPRGVELGRRRHGGRHAHRDDRTALRRRGRRGPRRHGGPGPRRRRQRHVGTAGRHRHRARRRERHRVARQEGHAVPRERAGARHDDRPRRQGQRQPGDDEPLEPARGRRPDRRQRRRQPDRDAVLRATGPEPTTGRSRPRRSSAPASTTRARRRTAGASRGRRRRRSGDSSGRRPPRTISAASR